MQKIKKGSFSVTQQNSIKQDNFCLRRSTTRRSSVEKPRLITKKWKNTGKYLDDEKDHYEHVNLFIIF